MDHIEIKMLLSYLEDNREHLNRLQNDFISHVKQNYKWTGIITTNQIESLMNIKEKVPSLSE